MIFMISQTDADSQINMGCSGGCVYLLSAMVDNGWYEKSVKALSQLNTGDSCERYILAHKEQFKNLMMMMMRIK